MQPKVATPKSIQLVSAIMVGLVTLKPLYSLVSIICCTNSPIEVSIYHQLSSLPRPAKCAAAVLDSQLALCNKSFPIQIKVVSIYRAETLLHIGWT